MPRSGSRSGATLSARPPTARCPACGWPAPGPTLVGPTPWKARAPAGSPPPRPRSASHLRRPSPLQSDSPISVAASRATPPAAAAGPPVSPGAPASPASLQRLRPLVERGLRQAVEGIADERMRLIGGYQLGLWDRDGTPTPGTGGKAVRPTLALLAAEAAAGAAEPGLAAAVAVELVHNFS